MPVKFPDLIHVEEEKDNDGSTWLNVLRDGVLSIEEPGKEVAIYKRVEVGRVKIEKLFITKKRK